jgi:ribonuclease D
VSAESAIWVRTPADVAELRTALEGCRGLGLDTESDSLYHHREKVCLIQLATDRGSACLIDPLAVRELSPLGEALADPDVVKVLHGADYDVISLKRDFGYRIERLFDTMIAARFLGLPAVGLQAVLRAELAIDLSKESQKDDWSIRPLTPAQESYALADVRHLLPLYDRLSARLREQGRLGWVFEESSAVAALEPARREREPDDWLQVKGARRLSPRQQAVLRELFDWREELAETTDVPAFRILSPQALVSLAQAPPRERRHVRQMPGLPRLAKSHADDIVAAVRRAEALPDERLPRVKRDAPPSVPAAIRRRIDALRGWRIEVGRRLQLDPSLVLPQRLLEKVAEAPPADAHALESVPGFRRWRIEAFGEEIVAAAQGAR